MKFTDGNWMMRAGVTPYYPAEGYSVDTAGDALTILAPTHRINHRGDTLWGPALTVRVSSPMEDVVGVRIDHFKGMVDHGPHFELAASKPCASVQVDDNVATLTSGRLSARVDRKNWGIDFLAGGQVVTRSADRGIALIELAEKGPFVHEELALGVGECVYGLGERFTALVKNGQVVETWNKDGGTGSDQAYKAIPFYMTNRGYGVFVNQPDNVEFEVATEKVSRVQFCVPGRSLEYYVIYGPTPKEVLEKYTALTGRPALPPPWSFGLWLTTSFTTNYDEKSVTEILDGMVERDLPLHVFHFDCFWMKGFHWCDFRWDDETFPNPPEMLKRLKARGLKICVWINPYIAERSYLFDEGKKHGYLIKKANGDVWQTDMWQPGMGIVDFTNPDACKWFAGKLKVLLDQGVDCFKTDFGERIPTDVVYHDGADPVKMHNYYTYLYNKVVFDLLEKERGKGEAALFARSATVGGQQFPIHWGGDCYSNFESMAETLRGGLSLCLSGFGYWSHDIGGFEGKPAAEIYKRWIAFGLLSSHSRLHGSGTYRVPWLFDDEAVDVLRFFTKLKCSLMPYLFNSAVTAHQKGVPMVRAMMLEFPGNPAMDYLDRQFMLGDSLLVAPVFSKDFVDYYVPEGRWTSLISGETIDGPTWRREQHGFLSIPLLVRPNTILAIGQTDQRPDYDFAEGVTLRVYELGEGRTATATIAAPNGKTALTATATRSGGKIDVAVEGKGTWTVELVGIDAATPAGGATVAKGERGVVVTPARGAKSVSVTVGG